MSNLLLIIQYKFNIKYLNYFLSYRSIPNIRYKMKTVFGLYETSLRLHQTQISIMLYFMCSTDSLWFFFPFLGTAVNILPAVDDSCRSPIQNETILMVGCHSVVCHRSSHHLCCEPVCHSTNMHRKLKFD